MKISELGLDAKTGRMRYRIDKAVWNPIKRRGEHIRREVVGARALAAKIAEIEQLAGGSLTSPTFGKCVAHAVRENGGAGMPSVYAIIDRELGKYRVDRNFVFRYQAFIDELKAAGRGINTIANYKSCIRHVLKKAWTDHLINDIPIRDYGIKRRFRARIWSQDERVRIFNQLDQDGNMFWMLHFAERNPIRKMDLVNLTRETWYWSGSMPRIFDSNQRKRLPAARSRVSSWIWTRRSWRGLLTLLRRFPDCPYLFPAIYKNKRLGTERWAYQGNPKKHFAYVCNEKHANVTDFHFHDLKHVAITHMLKVGVGRDALKKRGIQLSDRSIDVYDATDAFDTVSHRLFIGRGEGVSACSS